MKISGRQSLVEQNSWSSQCLKLILKVDPHIYNVFSHHG